MILLSCCGLVAESVIGMLNQKFWLEKSISESVRFAEDNKSSFWWLHLQQPAIKVQNQTKKHNNLQFDQSLQNQTKIYTDVQSDKNEHNLMKV